MRNVLICLVISMAFGLLASEEADSTVKPILSITYYHTTYRCQTCNRIEDLTEKALKENFETELDEGKFVFSSLNLDEDANKHFAEDYSLLTKSVIISTVDSDGKEKWKNLTDVWVHVRKPKDFESYIVEEITVLMDGNKE